MSEPLINLPKLNFNLFVFIASMITICASKHYGGDELKLFGIVAGIASLISLLICLWSYTHYYIAVTKNKEIGKELRKNGKGNSTD